MRESEMHLHLYLRAVDMAASGESRAARVESGLSTRQMGEAIAERLREEGFEDAEAPAPSVIHRWENGQRQPRNTPAARAWAAISERLILATAGRQ